MKEIRSMSVIDATTSRVWDVLMDFYNYSEWSTFINRIEGDPEVGNELEIVMKPPEGKEVRFKPKVLVKEKEKEFRWKGEEVGSDLLFNGEHYFIIERIDENKTRLVHGEIFTGALAPALWRSMNTDIRRGLMEFNNAIKEKAESG